MEKHSSIKLMKKVTTLQLRQTIRERVQLIERLEAQGIPRKKIAVITGRSLNYIRQMVYIARQAGRLPGKGEGNAH